MAKINISIDDSLLERLDRVADENYMSRSGLISQSVIQYLNQFEIVLAIKSMGIAMNKIAEQGEVDEETQKQLDDFERICRMFAK